MIIAIPAKIDCLTKGIVLPKAIIVANEEWFCSKKVIMQKNIIARRNRDTGVLLRW